MNELGESFVMESDTLNPWLNCGQSLDSDRVSPYFEIDLVSMPLKGEARSDQEKDGKTEGRKDQMKEKQM